MLPLADLRIVAIEQFGAGPFGTMQLADLGADVVKVEDPSVGGDVGRYVPPFAENGSSLFFESFNRGKRSVTLDLRSAEGREAFEELVRDADAVFSNLRGDQPARLRLRYEDLAVINPRIVCVSLSGFGNTGPRAGGRPAAPSSERTKSDRSMTLSRRPFVAPSAIRMIGGSSFTRTFSARNPAISLARIPHHAARTSIGRI